AATLLSGGCTYAKEEPGLFRGRATSSPATETLQPPVPTNPELPAAAEPERTTAEGLQTRTRFAIHAIRRFEVGTVVDWSVTPLSAPRYAPGEKLPSWVDLGLSRSSEGDVNIFLIARAREKIYGTL